MYKHEVEEYANYEVYEYLTIKEEIKKHTICICKELIVAKGIAIMLAKKDPKGDSYYVTGVNNPGAFIPGGGWYYEFHQKDGKILQSSLV